MKFLSNFIGIVILTALFTGFISFVLCWTIEIPFAIRPWIGLTLLLGVPIGLFFAGEQC